MATAYVDSSAVLAVAFGQPSSLEISQRLRGFDRRVSSNLLEAEVRAAFVREQREFHLVTLLGIEWIYIDRPLSSEFATVLTVGYLRGADLWHVAVALYAFPEHEEICFLTLDQRQQEVAVVLGFQV